jgi:hypothetical protein
MKTKQLAALLICSALGLVAAIAYVQRLGSAALPVNPIEAPPDPSPTLPNAPAVGRSSSSPVRLFSWREIESEDYHKYIANLRGIGCPEQTIRDIVLADINKLYADRETPLKTGPKPTPQNPTPETPEQKLERLKQLRAVQQEKRWAVKELLGIDLPLDLLPSSGARDYHAFEVALQSISPDKRDAVQSLQENYWQQSDALKAKYGQKRPPEYLAEYRQLGDTLRQELSRILTPQELEDYAIRTSGTAKQLSDKLATYFHPTEDEFRQIYRAKRDYDQAIEQLSAAPPQPMAPDAGADPQAVAQARAAERQARQQSVTAVQNQMNDQLKNALGDSRYGEYERSQDRNYDLLARLGLRYNVPQDTVLQAYDLQNSFKAQVAPGPDGAAPAADQAALQKQLNDQLTAILGDQAARGYRRVHGGSVPVR